MTISSKPCFRVLTIAGSDSGGGAGIQADLKTFAALGCYGTSVITALTAQNTKGVAGIFPVTANFVGQQMDAVLSDIGTDAVKIGMLHDPEIIEIVAAKLQQYECENIVLDPVMVAKSGDRLLQSNAVNALKKYLLPMAAVITPNLPEAEDLLGIPVQTRNDMQKAAGLFLTFGPQSVTIKGGHLAGDNSADFYLNADGSSRWLEQSRIETKNNHGTGCTFSSAIAAHLARGEELQQAIENAKTYISAALFAGASYGIGEGHGPVQHFFAHEMKTKS